MTRRTTRSRAGAGAVSPGVRHLLRSAAVVLAACALTLQAAEVHRAAEPPITVPGLPIKPAAEVKAWVLARAGARPADRGPVDTRLIDEVRTGQGKIIASQADVGGWPDLAENRRPLTLPDKPCADDDGDGYTNLEEWLHGFAAEVEAR
ncbi:MAG: hypothetical protein R6X20_08195 [Phycisphaerae bacterium]